MFGINNCEIKVYMIKYFLTFLQLLLSLQINLKIGYNNNN